MSEHGDKVAALAPWWLGDVAVDAGFNPRTDSVLYTVHFDFQSSQWCKITEEGIDVPCKMRAYCEFPSQEVTNEAFIAESMFKMIVRDVADLVLTMATEQNSGDALLENGYKAKFVPRDSARMLLISDPDYFAPKIAEGSSFRDEGWYREWAESND